MNRAGASFRLALLVVANVLGLFAFVWPFVLPRIAGSAGQNHANDGPWFLLALSGILFALLLLELGRGGLGPKTVALLGILGAAIVALRLPGFVAGFSAMFIVLLVAGNAFGPGFGFLLGTIGMLASGLFVGGLGPWLPFEMVAFGWVGAGAGLLPLAWDPGAGAAMNVRHYVTFYAATSFVWDTFRAVGNAVLVLVLGRPLLLALDRAARRMHLEVRPAAGAGLLGAAAAR